MRSAVIELMKERIDDDLMAKSSDDELLKKSYELPRNNSDDEVML